MNFTKFWSWLSLLFSLLCVYSFFKENYEMLGHSFFGLFYSFLGYVLNLTYFKHFKK
ncbi:MAG: hypothetical protein RL621_2175 [Bacteroidota bacterium]|jgi:membrane associated rhomboid family serine protease